MAQTYTLDEAADKLGITASEFKRRLREEWKHVRSMRDGGTLRFRANDIEELSRSTSDSDPQGTAVGGKKPGTDDDIPLILDSGPDLNIGDMPKAKSGSDSDVRLEKADKARKVKQEATEEISLELPKSKNRPGGSTNRLPKVGAAVAPSKEVDGSEFELTLETDSDEFELALNTDSSSSEDVNLGKMPKAPAAGRSGINIGKAADSGLSLEKKKKKDSSEDIDFEVNLDPDTGKSGKSSMKLKGKKDDSDSEFELNLDESSEGAALEGEKGDIFETDFELPALEDDSASEVAAMEESDTDLENSDFDLAVDGADSDSEESASEVMELDDEDEPKAKKGGKAKPKKLKGGDDDDGGISFDDMDLDESMSASRALKGARADDFEEVDEDGRPYAAGAMVPAPPSWSPLAIIPLAISMFLLFLGGLMGYELLHSMWGYQQPSKPSGILVEGIAKMFGVSGEK